MILLAMCLQLPAQSWETITVGSGIRKTYTYIPLNVEKSPALVISLHGMNQDPEYQQNRLNGMRWQIRKVLSLLIRWVITRCGTLTVLLM